MFKLFKTKKIKTKDHGYVVYRKRQFGSSYPNLSKEEENNMKAIFPITKKVKLVNVEHPNIYYRALYLSKILDNIE